VTICAADKNEDAFTSWNDHGAFQRKRVILKLNDVTVTDVEKYYFVGSGFENDAACVLHSAILIRRQPIGLIKCGHILNGFDILQMVC
jgi:hypothetical protein